MNLFDSAVELASLARWRIDDECASNPELQAFVQQVRSLGPLYIVGGAPRDWYFGKEPKDFDFVVDADTSLLEERWPAAGRTQFGGFRLKFGPRSVDLWTLASTWAFRNGIVSPVEVGVLPRTNFFDIDSLVIDLDPCGLLYEAGFFGAFAKKQMDVVQPIHSSPALCLARGLAHAKKYDLTFAPPLVELFDDWTRSGTLTWKKVQVSQKKYYGEQRYLLQDAEKYLPETIVARLAQ